MLTHSSAWVSTSQASEINLVSAETEALKQLLGACDNTLTACTRASKDNAALIEAQQRMLNTQAERITRLEDRNDTILNNPLAWFIGGMLTTGLTVYLIK